MGKCKNLLSFAVLFIFSCAVPEGGSQPNKAPAVSETKNTPKFERDKTVRVEKKSTPQNGRGEKKKSERAKVKNKTASGVKSEKNPLSAEKKTKKAPEVSEKGSDPVVETLKRYAPLVFAKGSALVRNEKEGIFEFSAPKRGKSGCVQTFVRFKPKGGGKERDFIVELCKGKLNVIVNYPSLQ